MTQVPMLDVSSANHPTGRPIDWQAVYMAGYKAVMIKATEGTSYRNPWLETDAKAADAAGLGVGYYHYAHPALADPTGEAAYALKAITGLPRVHGLALDLELTEGRSWAQLGAYSQLWFDVALKEVDHVADYMPPSFFDAIPDAPYGHRIWLPSPTRPRRQVWAWQSTMAAKVPGILIPTDIGVLHPDDA